MNGTFVPLLEITLSTHQNNCLSLLGACHRLRRHHQTVCLHPWQKQLQLKSQSGHEQYVPAVFQTKIFPQSPRNVQKISLLIWCFNFTCPASNLTGPTQFLVARTVWPFVIQIKYGLPYCVTCPSMSTDPGSLNPGTRRSRVPGWWDPGIRMNTGAGDTDLAKHT